MVAPAGCTRLGPGNMPLAKLKWLWFNTSMSKAVKKKVTPESDNAYFLKILIYLVLGTLWVKYNGVLILPLGLVIGLIIAQHDHFSIDRKIEYAILLVAMVVGLIGWGFYLNLNVLAS